MNVNLLLVVFKTKARHIEYNALTQHAWELRQYKFWNIYSSCSFYVVVPRARPSSDPHPKWFQCDFKEISMWIQIDFECDLQMWSQSDFKVISTWFQSDCKMISKWFQCDFKTISTIRPPPPPTSLSPNGRSYRYFRLNIDF